MAVSSVIVSLAVLKANWETKHESYIDTFNSLTAECLRTLTDDVVSSRSVMSALRNQFGLRLPRATVEVLLRRAAKRRLLIRDHGIYRINRHALDTTDFVERRRHFQETYDRLLSDLTVYAQERFPARWVQRDAESALLTYIDTNAMPILRARRTGAHVPVPHRAPRTTKYIFAPYLNHLIDERSHLFDTFCSVFEGNMLVNELYLPDEAGSNRFFRDTALYSDTRFLPAAVGYAGPSLQAPNTDLLNALYGCGAMARCFAHTFDEMQSVLRTCAWRLRSGAGSSGYGITFDYFLSKHLNESDVLLLAERLEATLTAHRVRLTAGPEYDHTFPVD